MTIATIPKPFYELAFNAPPNQSVLPPYWQDVSPRVLFQWTAGHGRQVELDVNETGTWSPILANGDGALDPSNTSSPFAPNVLLYRGSRIRVPLAPTQNLLPRNVGTGLATMNPVNDAAGNWFYPVAGSVAPATNLSPAAPSGQSTAVAWTTPSGTTNASPLYAGVAAAGAASAVGPVADCVQVTAAQQYTVSVYLMRTSSADATVAVMAGIRWFDVNGNALSATNGAGATVPVGSWVRATATGTAPTNAVWGRPRFFISTPASTTATNVIYAAGWQLEQAAAATSWADPGDTRFIHTGGVERWPQTWTEMEGTLGTSPLISVDAAAGLAQPTLLAPYLNEVLATGPNFFYPLSEPAGSGACADLAGRRIPAPVENSPYGVGSLVFGSSITSANPGQAFTGSPGPVATFSNTLSGPGTQSAETFISLHKTTTTPGPPTSGSWTRVVAFRTTVSPSFTEANIWTAYPPSWLTGNQSSWWVQIVGPNHLIVNQVDLNGAGLQFNSTANYADGNWHQVITTTNITTNTITFYVDGAQVASTSGGGANTPSGIVADVIGCSVQPGTNAYSQGFIGDVAHAVELPVAISATQAANLYNSWRTASAGDSTGTRIQRVLTWVGYKGATAIDTGMTTSMGPATDLTGAAALDALNNIALTENGDVFVSSAGVLTFKSRAARYNQRTPAYTFGEGAPVGNAGEWPCEISQLEYDPALLGNNMQITQYGGPLLIANDTTSQQNYYQRTYQRTVNVSSVNEAQDAANYLLAQYKDPHLRTDVIRLHPSAVPGLFAVCLQLEKGTRIRVVRRPNGAPTITVDCFVEKLDWSWEPDTGDVWLEVQASPANLTNYWQLAALHGTLNAQANSGTNTVTINALPDAAVNMLSQSLPSTYSLTFEPGTARAETVAIAAGGIPATSPGYSTATITLAANLAFTHAANSPWCEPLPTGYTDPTTWDASSVIGAASTTVLGGGGSGTNTVTVGPLQDSKVNALGSTWNTGDTIWLSPGTGNFESAVIGSVAFTVPGYTSCVLTLAANLAHSHAVGDIVCDPLPAGVTNPSAIAATARLAY